MTRGWAEVDAWRRHNISSRGRIVQEIRPHRVIALSNGLRLRLRADGARSQKE